MRFSNPLCTISAEPDAHSTTVSQGLYGEPVELQESVGEYCRVLTVRDAYEGYVPAACLEAMPTESTHFVCTSSTLMFSEPNIKSPAPVRLLFGSELVLQRNQATDAEGTARTFYETDKGLFVLGDHCRSAGENITSDIATMAEQFFLGVPYLWGGRSVDGFDCSGLVQMTAFAAGVSLPRDSNLQEAFLQNTVSPEHVQRSDLVYWPGHVGVMLDNVNLLHATAHSMLSVIEPLEVVISRAGAVSSVKRP